MFANKIPLAIAVAMAISSAARSEEIFYGNRPIGVEIRADTSTLILLPAPPLSVSCQPANKVQFHAIDKASLSAVETGYVNVAKPGDEEENPKLKRMIRVVPSEQSGSSTCTFNLSNSHQVATKFMLKNDITRPFVEFRPLSERNANLSDPARNLALESIKSSVGGLPLHLLKEDSSIFGYRRYGRELARYQVTYRGGNGSSLTLWKIEGTVQAEKVSYDDLAVLTPQTGAVFYSALLPDQKEFRKGEVFELHVVGPNNLTEEELVKALR